MEILFTLFVGILIWIIFFKTSKERIYGKIITATLISIIAVTMSCFRFNYISSNTEFILVLICLVIIVIRELIYKQRKK